MLPRQLLNDVQMLHHLILLLLILALLNVVLEVFVEVDADEAVEQGLLEGLLALLQLRYQVALLPKLPHQRRHLPLDPPHLLPLLVDLVVEEAHLFFVLVRLLPFVGGDLVQLRHLLVHLLHQRRHLRPRVRILELHRETPFLYKELDVFEVLVDALVGVLGGVQVVGGFLHDERLLPMLLLVRLYQAPLTVHQSSRQLSASGLVLLGDLGVVVGDQGDLFGFGHLFGAVLELEVGGRLLPGEQCGLGACPCLVLHKATPLQHLFFLVGGVELGGAAVGVEAVGEELGPVFFALLFLQELWLHRLPVELLLRTDHVVYLLPLLIPLVIGV
mmetsp:Transcript_20706/g.19739  ORF Transcript_20706/g.19739 Transcript_20706/m.19739 type:complete len:330 (-) Transcript_20706:354-1343(-)